MDARNVALVFESMGRFGVHAIAIADFHVVWPIVHNHYGLGTRRQWNMHAAQPLLALEISMSGDRVTRQDAAKHALQNDTAWKLGGRFINNILRGRPEAMPVEI